ncbi:MAG: putative structural protein [Prokaryotic dsDNA virus sp.]|nr:MAG: putative structural protein [Prokaryotic dsDNA virus sp.]|tara:strand:- start:26346 stop:31475 length:5130 start_codon:yes stop_codon:yes gene_type:complete
MPKLTRNFTKGIMNRVVDQRLIPNGEYISAINVRLGSTELSEIGSLENSKGNSKLTSLSYGSTEGTLLASGVTTGESVAGDIVYDNTATFIADTVQSGLGQIATNTTTGQSATVDGTVTDTEAPLSSSIFGTGTLGNSYEIRTATIPNYLSNDAVCIGAYEDGGRETMYWFVHDPSFSFSTTGVLDLVVSYHTPSGTVAYHLVSVDDGTGARSTLNFNPQYTITGVDMVSLGGGSIDCGPRQMLFWTDDYNPPRRINVDKGYSPPNAGYVDQFTAESIMVIKKPPAQSPIVITDDTGGDQNYMEDRFLCFAYRYKYEDGEYSATSQFSSPAFLPNLFLFSPNSFLNEGMVNIHNQADITFNTGGPLVVAIDLLFKDADNSTIKVIEKINKAEMGYGDNQDVTFAFNNSKIFTVLPEAEILRLYDNVPRFAKAQTLMGNRLMYGNYVEGYDLIDNTGQALRLDYQAILRSQNLGFYSLTTSTSLTTYNLPGEPANIVSNIGLAVDFSDLPGPMTAGSVLEFNLTFQHDSFTSNTVTALPQIPFTVTFLYVLPQDFANAYELGIFPDFVEKVENLAPVYSATDPTSCSFTTFTDEFYCAASAALNATCTTPNCVPDNSVTKYAGAINSVPTVPPFSQGIFMNAYPANVNQLTFLFPAVLYVGDVNNPNTSANVWEYFSITSSAVDYAEGGIPPSLHSDRGYEVGIVYMDEFNRSTTALVSDTNTIHVPCAASDLKNNIRVEIPDTQVAPIWAHRYKFVVKPDKENYDTIYSLVVYSDPATDSDYILLDGENARKVQEGDRLTVKTDADGPINQCIEVTVLEKKAQENNFITIYEDDGVTQIPVPAGVYMKIKAKDFNIQTPQNNILLPGQESDTQGGSSGSPTDCAYISQYPDGWMWGSTVAEGFSYDDGGTWVDIPIPLGSSIRIRFIWKRTGGSGGSGCSCEKREATLDKTFVVNDNYNSVYDWWMGDNIASQVNGQDNFTTVDLGCPAENCPISNLFLDAGTGLPFTSASIPCEGCTNYMRFYKASPTDPLYFGITGTKKCSGAGLSKNKRSTVKVTFEIYLAGDALTFETQPTDALPDVWYENGTSYGIDRSDGSHLGNLARFPNNVSQDITTGVTGIIDLDFFNCYSFGNGAESYKIRDSITARTFNLGNRVTSTSSQDYGEADRFADITYSGVINDESNVNKLNEFNLGLLNFKPLEDSFGPIFILSGRKTDVLVLQEDKISYVLAGKNLLSDAAAGGAVTSVPEVLGTQIAREEEYGISQNPESFCVYGYDKYFTDAKRGAVIQLKGGGQNEKLTIISDHNMRSWFRDLFIDDGHANTQKLGGFDPYMNEFVLSSNNRGIPIEGECFECDTLRGIDLSLVSPVTLNFELGTTIGEVTVNFTVISPIMNFGYNAYWNNTLVATGSELNAIAGSQYTFSFDKTLVNPSLLTIVISGSEVGGLGGVMEWYVACPVPTEITVIQVCLTNPGEMGSTIHNQTRWNSGAFTSVWLPASSTPPVTFGPGPSPVVSQYDVTTGPQGFGGIPLNGSTVGLYTRVIGSDDFVFDPSADKYYWLRSATLYDNNTTDINALMAIVEADVSQPLTIDSTLAPGQYSGTFTMPTNNLQYLYLIYDYRSSQEISLCHDTVLFEVCCNCNCVAGQCTKYRINWIAGPTTNVTYTSCSGTSELEILYEGLNIEICVQSGNIPVIQDPSTVVEQLVIQCNCT